MQDPRFDSIVARGVRAGDYSIDSMCSGFTRLPSIPQSFRLIIEDALRCGIGRTGVPTLGTHLNQPRMFVGAVMQIYMYCEARAQDVGDYMVPNTKSARWGFLHPGTGHCYNRSVLAAIIIAIGLDVDARGLATDDAEEVVSHNLRLALGTGDEFGLRLVTLFLYLGGLPNYSPTSHPELHSALVHHSGVDMVTCTALYDACVYERSVALYIEKLLEGGAEEVRRIHTYSKEAIDPIKIHSQEWKYGTSVETSGGNTYIKFKLINGVRVYPSKFSRNLAVLLGLGVNVPGLDGLLKVIDLTAWPVDDLYCGSGVGFYKLRDTDGRSASPATQITKRPPSRSMLVDSNANLRVYSKTRYILSWALISMVIALGVLGVVYGGPGSLLGLAGLVAAIAYPIISALSDVEGWGAFLMTGYRKVGSGETLMGDSAGVVVECFRARICPFVQHTCWYDGAPAKQGGLPCGGLLVSRLVRGQGVQLPEYSRGLLSTLTPDELNAQASFTPDRPKPAGQRAALFMVEGIGADGYAYGCFRTETAWPFDMPVVKIGGYSQECRGPAVSATINGTYTEDSLITRRFRRNFCGTQCGITSRVISSLPADSAYSLSRFKSSAINLDETVTGLASEALPPKSSRSTTRTKYRGLASQPVSDARKMLRDTKEVYVKWRLSKRETERIESGKAPLAMMGRYIKVRGRFEVTVRTLAGVLDINKKYRSRKLVSIAHVEPGLWCCRITTHATTIISQGESDINIRLSSKRSAHRRRGQYPNYPPLRAHGTSRWISPPNPNRFWNSDDYLSFAQRAGWYVHPTGITVGPFAENVHLTLTHPLLDPEPITDPAE